MKLHFNLSPNDCDLLLLLNDIFPIFRTVSGGFINLHKSSILPLSPLSFPNIPNSPPISTSLSILGFTLPLNSSNIEYLWSSLKQKITTRADIISSRNLSLKGRILLIKSLLLSKLWYYVPICPPPPSYLKSIQQIINNFLWMGSKTHPAFHTTILPTLQGGISLPDFKLECRIRSAKLISHAFDPDPPFWTKQLNDHIISKYSQTLPACIINRRNTNIRSQPLRSFLNSSFLIENLSPGTIPSLPTLPTLRNILLIPPSPPYTPFSPSPHLNHITWKEIHHCHYPRRTQDLLWKISHHSLPIGISIAHISPHSGFCPWCPTIPNTSHHLFHSCPLASTLWSIILSISHIISPNSSPASNIQLNRPTKIKHISRLLISSLLWTIWTSYTSTSFGSSPPIPISHSPSIMLSHILSYRSITPKLPWPTIYTLSIYFPPPL